MIAIVAAEDTAIVKSPNERTQAILQEVFHVGRDPAELLHLARMKAVAEPLEPAPFFIAAAVAESQGDEGEAFSLLQETVRKRTSYSPARIWLAGYFLRTGRVAEAVAQADLAMRSSISAQRTMIPLLVSQVGTAPGLGALLATIHRLPPWRNDFINAAIRKKVPTESLFAILSPTPPGVDTDVLDQQRSHFVVGLTAQGDYERAYLAWISFLPDDTVGKIQAVYDGDFQKLRGPAPFNWTLYADNAGYAEYSFEGIPASHFLDVRYATGSNVLAQQSLLLGPGIWRLSMQVRGGGDGSGGALRWTVLCAPSNLGVGTLLVDSTSDDWRTVQAQMVIPTEGCEAQNLQLRGVPSESTEAVSAQFRALRMSRIGA